MISITYIIRRLREQEVPVNEIKKVLKAYKIAAEIHKDVYRESGEPYIYHPLSVAINLIDEMDSLSVRELNEISEKAKERINN